MTRSDSKIYFKIFFFHEVFEKRIIPSLIEYVSEGSHVENNGLKDLLLYILLRSNYGAFLKEFITEELFNTWINNIKDPDEHPRVRAAWACLLNNPSLTTEQKKRVEEIYLHMTRPPLDWNLRSKSCWHLGLAGERRVLPMLYELALSRDAPYWIFHNASTGLYYLEAHTSDPASWNIKAGALKLVNLLEILLIFYPKPISDVKIIQPNNFFTWGIQYWSYPPFFVLERLRSFTGKDFDYDIFRWRKWLENEP